MEKEFIYGMRLRGFSPGCQPMNGLKEFKDTDKRQTGFHSILTYCRKLTEKELAEYELIKIKEVME